MSKIAQLVQATWEGDHEARLVLADACDDLGRHDCAMMFREQLPGHRRRQRVDKLSERDKQTIQSNVNAWRDNVMYRTGPSDALLAAASIYAVYNADALHRSEYPLLPKITWMPSPYTAAKYVLDLMRRDVAHNDVTLVWFQYNGRNGSSLSTRDNRAVTDIQFATIPDLTSIVERAGDAQYTPLSHGVACGQLDQHIAITAATVDVYRLNLGDNNERSLRGVIGLAQVAPYWLALHNEILLSAHPTVFDTNGAPGTYGAVPRWMWIDDDNQGQQWPTTL